MVIFSLQGSEHSDVLNSKPSSYFGVLLGRYRCGGSWRLPEFGFCCYWYGALFTFRDSSHHYLIDKSLASVYCLRVQQACGFHEIFCLPYAIVGTPYLSKSLVRLCH